MLKGGLHHRAQLLGWRVVQQFTRGTHLCRLVSTCQPRLHRLDDLLTRTSLNRLGQSLENFALQGKLQVTNLCFTIPNLLIFPALLILTQVYRPLMNYPLLPQLVSNFLFFLFFLFSFLHYILWHHGASLAVSFNKLISSFTAPLDYPQHLAELPCYPSVASCEHFSAHRCATWLDS